MSEAVWSVASIGIVFGLVGLLVWVSRSQSAAAFSRGGSRRIHVAGQVRLNPQCSVAIVRLDDRLYHMAVTNTGVHVLHASATDGHDPS